MLAAVVVLLALAGCGSDDPLGDPRRPGGPLIGGDYEVSGLTGELGGAGSSAQESAMAAWIAGFQARNPGVSVAYDPIGSGGGRTQFVEGGIAFGGSDAPLDDGELTQAAQRCGDGVVVELPLYVSPIAVVFNLDQVTELNMSPETVAGIFAGTIDRWDDPRIAQENPGVDLPDLRITAVHRSDESGTTENFTEYLHEAAGDAWPYPASGSWPRAGGQSAQGNSGVVQTVTEGHGTITYADASKAGTLGTVRVRVGDDYVGHSPEAAAAVMDVSPIRDGRSPGSLVVDLDRATTESGTYPVVLVAYTLACTWYEDQDRAQLVRAFLSWVASEEAQQQAAVAAGSAPISADLRERLMAVIERIGEAEVSG